MPQILTEHEKRLPKVAASRMQAVLSKIMIRRNKDSKLNGTRLVVLPKKHVEDVTIELEDEERAIYNFIEQKARLQFNKVG